MTTFDSTLTVDGKPYWESTHDKHVNKVASEHGITVKKKEVKPKEVLIKSKNGQTKRVVI